MATIKPTIERLGVDESLIKVTWANISEADVGDAVGFAEWADRSVQVFGNFGASGALDVEGSNDGGVNFDAITDPQGNPISILTGSAHLEQLSEVAELTRPIVSAGTGVSLTCVLFCRRANNMRT